MLYNCPKNAACVNDAGSYHCGCKAPFTGSDPASCYCELSGYWAMRQDLTTCWTARTIAGGAMLFQAGVGQSTGWELHKYTYDGSTIKVEKSGCGSDIVPDFISPVFNETYSTYVPDSVVFAIPPAKGKDIPAPAIVPGSMFTTPMEASVSGIDLGPDPETAPFPTDYTMVHAKGGAPPAWTDDDSDGEPGVTLWPALPSSHTLQCVGTCPTKYSYLPLAVMGNPPVPDKRAGCVSAAARIITKLDTMVNDCEKMTGEVINVKAEGRVEGCTVVPSGNWNKDVLCSKADWDTAKSSSATTCAAADVMTFDMQDQSQTSKATFELVKIGELSDTPDCLAVRAALPAIDHGAPMSTCPF
jgi:hypothetical protein